jgi:hypothetical protein
MTSKKTSAGNAGIKKAIKIISADLPEAEKRLQNNEKKRNNKNIENHFYKSSFLFFLSLGIIFDNFKSIGF